MFLTHLFLMWQELVCPAEERSKPTYNPSTAASQPSKAPHTTLSPHSASKQHNLGEMQSPACPEMFLPAPSPPPFVSEDISISVWFFSCLFSAQAKSRRCWLPLVCCCWDLGRQGTFWHQGWHEQLRLFKKGDLISRGISAQLPAQYIWHFAGIRPRCFIRSSEEGKERAKQMWVQMERKKWGFQGSSIKKSKEEKTELKIISWHVLGRDTSI